MIGSMQWIRTAPLVTREQYRARMAEQEWGLGPPANFQGSLPLGSTPSTRRSHLPDSTRLGANSLARGPFLLEGLIYDFVHSNCTLLPPTTLSMGLQSCCQHCWLGHSPTTQQPRLRQRLHICIPRPTSKMTTGTT